MYIHYICMYLCMVDSNVYLFTECRLVELQTELTLQETIETYERAWRERKTAYEHLMTKVLREKESFGM